MLNVVIFYAFKTCLNIVIVQCLTVINSRPPPLLADFCRGYFDHGSGYIFQCCLIIIVNTK